MAKPVIDRFDLSPWVSAIRLTHVDPLRVFVDIEVRGFHEGVSLELIGAPSPSLSGRDVTFVQESSLETFVGCALDNCFALEYQQGALAMAVTRETPSGPRIELQWFVGTHSIHVVVPADSNDLSVGDLLVPDSLEEIDRRHNIVSDAESNLVGWETAVDHSLPPWTVEEVHGLAPTEEFDIPLSEAIGDQRDFACVNHFPSTTLESIVVELVAKLVALDIEVAPCEHMRIPHFFVYLTRAFIPTGVVSVRPRCPESRGQYFVSDHCPDCTVEMTLEAEGVRF